MSKRLVALPRAMGLTPTKRCSHCKNVYPATLKYFHRHRRHILQTYCRECNKNMRMQRASVCVRPNRVRVLRQEARMGLQELADHLYVNKTTVWRIESHKVRITNLMERLIARVLDVNVDDLYEDNENQGVG